ncbi:hypothetical protein [Undibacterium terreum]|uniref:Uncharacterized protein n=1 Tax=Undibacterium terreum TaxID=1224302 RepID=A0A916UZJ1_9BURK|nr:hypothetical protein [Undibacterium terreum]GGC94567.1 hypothetical protein GCM10011396_47390 [Undibacterium terreum]
MKLKDLAGMLFSVGGATLGTVAYRLLGIFWFFGGLILLAVSLSLIWSAARDRKLRDALDQVPGDWGDRHYLSGASPTDGFDFGDGHDDLD